MIVQPISWQGSGAKTIYSIEMLPCARKAMAALPRKDRVLMDQRIVALAETPRPIGAVPAQGAIRGLWRIRAGDYRVLYRVQDDKLVILVVDIGQSGGMSRTL